MNNIIKYPGLKPFASGDQWKGNRNGRPKGSIDDFRNKLSRQLAQDHETELRDTIKQVFKFCQQEEKWAIKLVINSLLPYFLGKPKPPVEEEAEAHNPQTLDLLSQLSDEKLLAIQKIINEE